MFTYYICFSLLQAEKTVLDSTDVEALKEMNKDTNLVNKYHTFLAREAIIKKVLLGLKFTTRQDVGRGRVAPLHVGSEHLVACPCQAALPKTTLMTAVQELAGIGIQRYLFCCTGCAKYVVLVALSAFSCVIPMIATGIAQ
jgi:hypothetical protein